MDGIYWLMLDVCSWSHLVLIDLFGALWCGFDWSVCSCCKTLFIYSTWQYLERYKPFILGIKNNRAFSCIVFK